MKDGNVGRFSLVQWTRSKTVNETCEKKADRKTVGLGDVEILLQTDATWPLKKATVSDTSV